MSRLTILPALLLLAGCGDVHTAWQDCCAPTVVVVVPARLEPSVVFGIGNSAGRVFLTLHVLGAHGEPVPHVLTTINVSGNATIAAGSELMIVPGGQSITVETDGLGMVTATIVGRGVVPVAMSSGLVGAILVLTIP